MFQRSLATPSQESLSLSTGNNGSLISWEEGLEYCPNLEEEEKESELPSDDTEKDLRDEVRQGHSTSGEEQPCVDLGRLVENLVDLRQELEEELNGCCKKTNISSREDQEETGRSSREGQEETTRSSRKGQEETTRSSQEDQEETGRSSREDQEESSISSKVVQCETSKSSRKNHQEKSGSLGENQERTWRSKSDDDHGESGGAQVQVKEAINKKHHAGHQILPKENSNPGRIPRNSPQEKEHLAEEELNEDTSVNAGKKDEEQEECREPSSPKVLSKVALFQVKAYQTKGSPETVRPSYGHKILDTSLKICPKGPGVLRVTASAKTEESTIKSVTTSNLSDTAPEDEDLPPPKVSELKKRFEQ